MVEESRPGKISCRFFVFSCSLFWFMWSDYDIIQEDDLISFINLDEFSPGKQIIIELTHSDGTRNLINLNHSYNHSQIDWYDEGSALNLIKKENLQSPLE